MKFTWQRWPHPVHPGVSHKYLLFKGKDGKIRTEAVNLAEGQTWLVRPWCPSLLSRRHWVRERIELMTALYTNGSLPVPPPPHTHTRLFCYHPQAKFRKGNVFTPVCQSFCSGGCLPQCMLGSPPGRHPPTSRWLLLRTVLILLECILVSLDFSATLRCENTASTLSSAGEF